MLTTDKSDSALEDRIGRAARALIDRQQPDGHWVFELEADATIPAEYVLMRHFRGEPLDAELERKIAVYLRRIQGEHGGWPLFHDGAFDMSASVKAYFALKMIGDSVDAEHMRRAREAIRARGGAARANVFTRTLLALYGQISWRAVPMMPVEIMLLPKWFPFHLDKISYWSRTVIVPLLVLLALKPRAKNAKGVRIDELFLAPPDQARLTPRAPHQNRFWFAFFRGVDHLLRAIEPLLKRLPTRQRAIKAAEAFTIEHLNGEDGIGAIFPAMVNSVLMFDVLGYPADHPHVTIARLSVEKLLVVNEHEAYCQPCVSPVWDTGLACHALLEVGGDARGGAGQQGPRMAQDASRSSTSKATGRRRGPTCGRAAGRSSTTTRTIPTSTTPRWWRWRWIARRTCRASTDLPRADRAGARMDLRHAEQERRLGRVRRRQRPLLSQPHSVRRPRRAARSADRRRQRALRVDAGAARRQREERSAHGAGGRLPAQVAASGRKLVRPLGHELHLRHLVGAVRAQHRRRRSPGAARSARRSTGW